MKNTIKLLGIIAGIALISFSFFACGEPEEEETPLSPVYIIAEADNDGVVTLGTTLYADYSGSEDVKFQWQQFEGDEDDWGKLKEISGETDDFFKPTEAGRYIVTVSLEGRLSVNSPSVTVRDASAALPPYAAFFGKWKYSHTHELSDDTNRKNLEQTVVITENSFKLDDNSSAKDHLYFVIGSWNEKDNKNHKNGNTGDYARSKYESEFPSGYRCPGRTESTKGAYGSTKELILYMNAAKTAFVRVGTSGDTIVSCVYVKDED
jgi:hypothetical protein